MGSAPVSKPARKLANPSEVFYANEDRICKGYLLTLVILLLLTEHLEDICWCSTQALIVGNVISVMDLRLRSLLLLL